MVRPTATAALLIVLAAFGEGNITAGQAVSPKLILITLDGARIEEIFDGLDLTALRSTLRQNQTVEERPVYRRFWAETPEQRREKLMPFFWATLMREHGSIAGNVRIGSSVTLTNRHRFSYPGYAEILLGQAHDDVIASNDPVRNPYVTVLEELKRSLHLPQSGIGVFTSWDVFSAIVEHEEGALTVNDGFRAFEHPDPEIKRLSDLQFLTPTPWDTVRHDVYTFRFAMAHLKTARPRVMYLALGETDDWAHDGRYDRVLEAYARTDDQLRELWTWLQSDDEYRGRTHILLTTDHGRGRTAQDWRNHGADVEGAQDVWIAFVSPEMPRRGEWREHAALKSNQIAATLAGWMGLDWSALRPVAGRAISPTPLPSR
jgi:hypothetical protein